MVLNTYKGEVPISPYIIPKVTIKPATESLWVCPLVVCAMNQSKLRTKFIKIKHTNHQIGEVFWKYPHLFY
jgi:hypothetical protein